MPGSNQQSSLLGKIAAYTEILEKDPKSTIFVSLSEAYRKLGMLEDARAVAETGLEQHDEFTPAHIVLARIYCQLGDYQSSSQHFDRALQLDPTSLSGLVGYARLKILTGDETGARELLLEARKQNPADPVINKLLLSLPEPAVEPEVEQPEGATESEDAQEDSAGSNASLVSSTLAELYLQQGLEEKALEMFRQLSAQSPNDLELRRKIRALEEKLSVDSSIKTDSETATQPVQSQPSGSEEMMISGAEEQEVQAAPAVSAGDSDDEPLHVNDSVSTRSADNSASIDRLSLWLTNIQQRRRDV